MAAPTKPASFSVPLVCAELTGDKALAATLLVSSNSSGRGDFTRVLYVENDLTFRR
jgi:hypothetical protein